MTDDVEVQRRQLISSLSTVLGRLAVSRDWLTIEQRVEISELLRDVADHLDRGRVLNLQVSPPEAAWAAMHEMLETRH